MKKKQYYNKITELNSKRFNETNIDIGDRVRQLKENFVEEFTEEVVDFAYEYCVPSYGDGVVFLTPEGKITGATFSTNTRQHPDNPNIEVYRLSQNWFANNGWEVEMLIDNNEWEKLQEKYGKEADFLDQNQLETIDVDLDQRIKEYLLDVIN